MGRWEEFLEDNDNRLSMTRLLMLLAFFPASVALFIIKTEDALLYYLGAFVLGYIGGKGADAWRGRPPGPSPVAVDTANNITAGNP